MKKRTKKLITAILSTGLIASTFGTTITSASAANVRMTENKFTSVAPRECAYLPVYGKGSTAYNDPLYNNAVKTMNYLQNLGFYYNNEALFYNGNTLYPQKVTTVYVSRTNDNGYYPSSVLGFSVDGTVYKDMTGNANSAYGMITIGPVDSSYMNDLGTARDVIAHEYVHLVTQQLAGWDGKFKLSCSLETGALMEAYSDILGELSSSDTPDWMIGSEVFKNNDGTMCYRNIANPSDTNKPNATVQVYYSDYNELKQANLPAGELNFYSASTVISHVAYLMTTTGMKKDWVAELWYNSLAQYKDPATATFIDCRKAVLDAAKEYADKNHYSYRNRMEMNKRIEWSFDKVNIRE